MINKIKDKILPGNNEEDLLESWNSRARQTLSQSGSPKAPVSVIGFGQKSNENGFGELQQEDLNEGVDLQEISPFSVDEESNNNNFASPLENLQSPQKTFSRRFRQIFDTSLSNNENATYYDEYDTIDWIRDGLKEKRLREKTEKQRKGNFIVKWLKKSWYRIQAWVLLTLIALLTGFAASFVQFGVEWLSDLKFGYCSSGFWLSSFLCCQEYSGNDFCEHFIRWNSALSISNANVGYLINYFLYILFSILFATVAAIYVKSFARWAAGSGIPEVKTILGGFVIREFASPNTLLIKCVGLILSVSSGLNLGKEGPMVHVGVCCADLCSKLSQKYNLNQAKKRELLSAAAAAGVSVAFGAPIGGVLFSLEEVSYYFPHKTLWRSFFCATLAAIVLKVINPYRTGQLVIFQVKYTQTWQPFELMPFFFLAVLGGLIGAFFIKMNIRMCYFRKHSILSKYPIQEVMIIAGITALVSYPNPYLRGNAGGIIGTLFAECDPSVGGDLCNPDHFGKTITWLLIACLLRLGLTIFTFGCKVPSGLFIPSLAIGAHLGRAVGVGMLWWKTAYPTFHLFDDCTHSTSCITPGVYALVGATAVLCGVTRMTVSLVVIVFELTGDLSYLIPIMFVIMVSKWVADAFGKESIYDEHILLNEYPFLDNKTEYRFTSKVLDIMSSELTVLEVHGQTVGKLGDFLTANNYTGYPIVTRKEEMIVVGYISHQELRTALERYKTLKNVPDDTPCYFTQTDINMAEADLRNRYGTTTPQQIPFVDLRSWMDEAPLQISCSTSLNLIFDLFKKVGLRYILVAERGVLMGVITKKDILQHINVLYNKRKPMHFLPRGGVPHKRKSKRAPEVNGMDNNGSLSSSNGEGGISAWWKKLKDSSKNRYSSLD